MGGFNAQRQQVNARLQKGANRHAKGRTIGRCAEADKSTLLYGGLVEDGIYPFSPALRYNPSIGRCIYRAEIGHMVNL